MPVYNVTAVVVYEYEIDADTVEEAIEEAESIDFADWYQDSIEFIADIPAEEESEDDE